MAVAVAVALTSFMGMVTPPASADTTPRVAVTGYAQYSGPLYQLPVAHGYNNTTVSPIRGFGLVDSSGVRMVMESGKASDHPVAQARYALTNLNSYRLTHSAGYLTIAEANAQRLIDTATVEPDGAMFLAYRFAWWTSSQVPWYSAMAQGMGLSTFSELYQMTNDPKWLDAAKATFLALSQAPDGDLPYVSYVDATGHLWLEEYPSYPAPSGQRVLNGAMFAGLGLQDYYDVTGDTSALALFRGLVETLHATVLTQFRRPGAISVYSLSGNYPLPDYHAVVIGQFLKMFHYTHDPQFAQMVVAFTQDYPTAAVNGRVTVTPRETRIYRVTAPGFYRVVQTKTVRFSRNSTLPTTARVRIEGGPIAYLAAAGGYKGWYFPEGPATAWMNAPADRWNFGAAIPLYLPVGTYTAYQISSTGQILSTRTIRFTHTTQAPTDANSEIHARNCYRLSAGPLAGYWITNQAGVFL